ncbi:MAG: SusD/RagB family nutrient-binding outer membrane lipoprotein [Bacteroidota bacterium]|nr:SusD/RagB family nutrient-binding outer membrane lipoprotein [Bacteroidota bacterium]
MKKLITMINPVKFILISILIFLGLTSCTERWEEMNTDPNRLTDLPDEYLFTSAVRGAFNDAMGDLQVNFGGQYAHIYISNNWVREIDKYNGYGTQDYPEMVFNGVYNSSIRNAVEVLKLTSEGEKYENRWHNVQAQIIAIVSFSKLTDMFGDVPYSEGGMAKYGIEEPVYDTQEDIYTDMVDRLENCISILEEPEAEEHIYASDVDPIFKGDLDKWIRFANTYRFHLAMRARFADPGKYESIITECLSLPLIESNVQNPTLETSESKSDLYNPWYWQWQSSQEGVYNLVWSDKFITTLTETNDPRLTFFASENPEGIYKGMPNGLTDEAFSAFNKKNASVPTGEFFAKDQPIYLITAAQIWLLRAETALFNINGAGGDANQMYQTAIELAMEQWNIHGDSIAAYLADEAEATLYGDQENMFRQISTQMWIACVPNAFESWCTIRRTGYPVIPRRTGPLLSQGITDGYMPTRVSYPITKELTINGDNLNEAISRLPGGEDKIDTKLWWDVRDIP